MSTRSTESQGYGRHIEGMILVTRQSIAERLADPFLTDHDRWVLRQFGRFLSGIAPEPDLRVTRIDADGSAADRARTSYAIEH